MNATPPRLRVVHQDGRDDSASTDRLAHREAVPGRHRSACARPGCAHGKPWHTPKTRLRKCERCSCQGWKPHPNAEVAPPQTTWTADQLMAASFPEPRWAVPGILAEGVTLFAGPPKVGKSWLSLGAALAVAAGGRVLDAIDVAAGPVLYLALEDTPRRLQTRIRKILRGQTAPSTLTLATACPTLPCGGADAIARWLDRNPGARLVVIDVFAKVRGPAPAGLSAYQADYHAMGQVKHLADAYSVAVLLVHHVRKMGSDDFLNEVSGTNGLAGALNALPSTRAAVTRYLPDATLVLKPPRGQADGVLHITGRDVDETEHALSFDPATGTWRLLDGPADQHRGKPGTTPAVIAEATGIARETVKKTCQRMAADGQLCADANGSYRLPGTATTPESVPAVLAVPEPFPASQNTASALGTPAVLPIPGVPGSVKEPM